MENRGNQSPTFSLSNNENENEIDFSITPIASPHENVIGSATNQTTLSERERQLAEILQDRKTMLMKANSVPGLTSEELEAELQQIGEKVRNNGNKKKGGTLRQRLRRNRKTRKRNLRQKKNRKILRK